MRPSRPESKNFLEINSPSAIDHLLSHCPTRISQLCIFTPNGQLGGRLASLQQKARAAGVRVEISIRPGHSGEPVKASLTPFRYSDWNELLARWENAARAVVLVLDHLQDPQNFGALCRTAEGLGVGGVILPKDRSVAVTPGVYSASVGAVETVPIVQVANLGEALRKLKDHGFWIIGASTGETAQAPWEMPPFEKAALVLGAELEGLSPLVEKTCDWLARVPLAGRVESLNVSVAGALLLYELLRPRA
jgi:23S rRNA (guanosine2251-2'-O)-methyltransferase